MSDDDPNANPDDPGHLRRLYEEAAQARAQAESELTALKAREAFRDAGLDPSKPLHQAVMRGYDGALDPEAVRNYVTELGVTEPKPPPQVETPPVPEDEQAALLRIAEAARDSGGPPPTPDRRAQLEREMDDAFKRRASKDTLDRLSEEYSRAGGYRVLNDMPGHT